MGGAILNEVYYRVMFSRSTQFNASGLDISDYSLKLAKIARRNNQLYLDAFAHVDIPPGIVVQGRIVDIDIFKAKLAELKAQVKKIKLSPYVITSLPETITYIKLLTVPQVSGNDLRDVLEQEIVKHFPYELHEIEVDYQIVNEFSGPSFDQMEVLVGVAPKEVVREYLTTLVACGLKPIAFEIEAQSIARSIIPLSFDISEGLGIMDIGASRSSFIIFDHGVLHMTVSMPISGREITLQLSKKIYGSEAEAEELKRKCGLDDIKCQGIIKDVLLSAVRDLTNKTKTALDFYYENFPSASPIKRIFLCGGGANTINIDRVLSQEFNLRVQRADTLVNVDAKTALQFINTQNSLGSASVLGLALREHVGAT